MTTRVQTRSGQTGYRHQLDRARRFLVRMESPCANDVEFQDMAWSFFQNCWHIKDWLKNDPLATDAQKAAAIVMAHQSPALKACADLCNATKHLGPRPGATPSHIDMKITPNDGISEIDCVVDDGLGQLISGKQLARDCIAEWVRILDSQGLATAQRS